MYQLGDGQAYASWTREHDQLLDADRDAIRQASSRRRPQDAAPVSVVIPAPRAGLGALARRALASVQAQLCPAWRLLAPAGLLGDATDPRFVPLAEDDDPVALCNAALDRASGDDDGWFVVLPPDAAMAEHAVFELLAAAAAAPDALLLFTDEDCIDAAGNRSLPRLKTVWDPDLLLGCNAVGSLAALRTRVIRDLGGLRPAPSLDVALYDLVLRVGALAPPSTLLHLPDVLCHRAAPPSGPGAAASWDAEAARAVVRRHLEETGVRGARVEPAPLLPGCNRVVFPLPDPPPLVSVVVPTRDRADLLSRCAEGVLSRTGYGNFELVIIDNDSQERETAELLARLRRRDPRVRVLPYPGAFDYARMHNDLVPGMRGEVVVLLNNDTDVIAPGWLAEMVSHALRPEVGAVGAKLLYADGRVQHCGVILGPDRWVIHQLRLRDRLDPGPFGELALVRSVSAVTGACMAFRKAVFDEVGGFNEALAVCFNDIDLCLRMGDHGYRIVCTPLAEFFHLESVTRGEKETPDDKVAFDREHRIFQDLWDPLLKEDPYHNPNVVFGWEETVLAAPPRRKRPWDAEDAWVPGPDFPAALQHAGGGASRDA